jgi:hypothetical protein
MRAFGQPFRSIVPANLREIGAPIPDPAAHRKSESAAFDLDVRSFRNGIASGVF